MNHASLMDPALIWAFHPHPVYFVAKEEFHRMPILGTASARLGNIGVRRGQFDRPALERSIDYLTVRGRVLGLFVEGTRTPDGELQEPRSGPALLALMTGVPMVPAYLHGTYDVFPRRALVPRWRPELRLVLGHPLQFPREAELPPKERLRSVAEELGQALGALRTETTAV
jgi:1-acyl-sn-glycerol-3-phosphate acyltransferase